MDLVELRKSGTILFETVSGSRAYGTNTPTSDTDYKGIYLAPLDDFIISRYQDQVSDEKGDTVFYELGRFMDLVRKQNPNILEMLFVDDEAIIYKHPLLEPLFKERSKFLTKTCRDTFAGYAISQIVKAKGLNKKINNPLPVERKGVLDFCYILTDGKTVPVKEWLAAKNFDQRYCGLVALNHVRYTYALYMDKPRFFNEVRRANLTVTINTPFKGIVQDEELSNDISLSSIPKEILSEDAFMHFNKDAYQVHCKEYREYHEWVQKRNPARYEITVTKGLDYDAKNMMHCIRLIRTAKEIAQQGVVNVRRPDREELLRIRNGEVPYEELMTEANDALQNIDNWFAASNLPMAIDINVIDNLVLSLRKSLYGFNF